ncbi:MAG: DPP IV N-terminal domain-containing protein [Candidatus Krumholzibacteriia bacterium]
MLAKRISIMTALMAVAMLALAGCGGDDGGTPTIPPRIPVVTQLTDDPAFEANPVFSRDGNWVYYERKDLENFQDHDIFRIPAAGGAPQELTSGEWLDTSVALSPDGTRMVFESDRSGTKSLWLMNLATLAEPTQLTDDDAEDGDPCWSPVDERVVFASRRTGVHELWLLDMATGESSPLTSDGRPMTYCRTPSWSPDGTELVFESTRDEASALYVLTIATGEIRRITDLAAYEGHPAWSPDGREIAFESRRNGTMDIFVVGVDGGTPFQVTNLGGYWPEWSPDGTRIIYGRYGSGEPDLWLVDVDWR